VVTSTVTGQASIPIRAPEWTVAGMQHTISQFHLLVAKNQSYLN